jgi:uncharacterized protein (TIRG00374 family)
VPVIIAYLIVTRIDLGVLKSSFLGTKSLLFALGLLHAPVLIIIAAYRWKVLLQQYLRKTVGTVFAFRHYWTGQALGFFTPASLGLDAYRVVVGGKRFGSYPKNVLIVLIEKLLALITCMAIIVVLYPLVSGVTDHRIRQIVLAAYVLLLASIATVLVAVLAGRNRVVVLLADRVVRYVSSVLKSVGKRIGLNGTAGNFSISLNMITDPLKSPRILAIIALSFGIQLVSSIKSQVYFISLGYDIPLVVNLFVTPMIYFIFLLPISLGSIGIREGVYILMYKMFGVPAEIALLISFYNLMGVLLNNAVGGIIILFSRSKPEIHADECGRQEPDRCIDGG